MSKYPAVKSYLRLLLEKLVEAKLKYIARKNFLKTEIDYIQCTPDLVTSYLVTNPDLVTILQKTVF